MSYKLLVEKLEIEKKKIITREELKRYCKTLKMPYGAVIGYLLSNEYLIRILRGIFYVKSIEERKKKIVDISFFNAISEAMKMKGINDWYFGLKTAIKLNNLTHEYFAIDYIISDKFKSSKPIEILGHKVRFFKIKKGLFEFGIKKETVPYSDTEKTILDMVYFGIYNSLSTSEIKNNIIDYLEVYNKTKLIKYSKYYPKSVLIKIKEIENDKKENS